MTLNEIPKGSTCTVEAVGGKGALRQHFLDMGVIPGVEMTLVKYAPMGDPIEFVLHGYSLTLRKDDAAKIEVKLCPDCDAGIEHSHDDATPAVEDHPGYGEMGWQHNRETEHPLPEGTMLTFALAGNQKCGKTTLFNQLTGANQHVGNFPGVTVDQKSGPIKGHPDTSVTDLPGIYSLSPYSNEEIVSREFILKTHPKGIINIVDATNIERNLYLTMQLMELNVPMVLALNMMDEVRNNGGTIRINAMERVLGLPVVPISAMKNEGVDELVDHALHVAKYQEPPTRQDFCSPDDHGGAVHRCIHAVMHLIEDHAKAADIPVRFAASKVIEGDHIVIKALKLSDNEQQLLDHILKQLEAERGLDPAAAMADMRYDFINKVCAGTVVKPKESKEHKRSREVDKVLTGRWTALPVFVAIMCLIFWLTFDVIGGNLQDLLQALIDKFTVASDNALQSWGISHVVRSLVIDGVYAGVGTVLSFLPIIVTLFLFLSLLEDSGYMARIAFVMDKLLRKIGLSGRSIVPLLMGFGCSVPSVMASRTLPSERDRRLTVMLTPFMSCTAKIAIYAFFCSYFFPSNAALVMISLYLLGIASGIVIALLLKRTTFKGEAVPFVMELPNYRMPGLRSVLQLLWDKTKDFIERAFSVIFIATIAIWFLQSFSWQFDMVSDSSQSMLASIAGFIAPVFKPLGFGDWKVTTALITGFMAKESVVSTLQVLFASKGALMAVLTPLTAYVLLVFCLLYTPCVATIATVKHELGGKWAAGIVCFQCAVAWIVAWIVKLALGLFW